MPPINEILRAGKSVEEVYTALKGLTTREFTGVLPEAMRAMHPGLNEAEHASLLDGAKKLIPDLIISDVKPAEYLGPRLDAKGFLANREQIKSKTGIDSPVAAFSLTDIYGRNINRYLDPVLNKKEIRAGEKLDAVPKPSAGNKDGLADYIDKRLATLGSLRDPKGELYMFKDIGERWSSLPPDLKTLPAEDLAFKLRTGMFKEEYRAAVDKPLDLRLAGNVAYAGVNKYPAGLLFRDIAGDNMTISQLSINPAFRQLNIGSSLMNFAERTAPPNVRSIDLNVGLKNLPARKFYSSLGYQVDQSRLGAGNLNMFKIIRPSS